MAHFVCRDGSGVAGPSKLMWQAVELSEEHVVVAGWTV